MNTFLTGFFILLLSSIYSIHFNSYNGIDNTFASYHGKKILMVNIATASSKANELAALEQLYEKYRDSLVVIAFPSNSFNNEPRSNNEIKAFCEGTYHTSFLIAEKKSVSGNDVQQIYNWIKQRSENGTMQGLVLDDFQMYLINGDGVLVAAFASGVSPMSNLVQDAITARY